MPFYGGCSSNHRATDDVDEFWVLAFPGAVLPFPCREDLQNSEGNGRKAPETNAGGGTGTATLTVSGQELAGGIVLEPNR